MKRNNLTLFAGGLIAGALFLPALQGCKKEGPAERAGEKIDNAAEKAGDKIDKAADKTGDALKNAGDKVKDSTDH
jgi:hyperosmotically inducible protein